MSALVQCASLRIDKAERFGNASINFQPQLGPRIGIGYALKNLGRQDEAYQYFRGAVGIFPDAADYDFVRQYVE